MTLKIQRGFTLIEVMVVVAILAILMGIALPSYKDHVIRAGIMPAVSGLSSRQAQMEQCYQDNHTYTPSGGCPVCATDNSDSSFTFSCTAEAGTFTLTATGKGKMAGFVYTVNQAGAKVTTVTDGPSGWSGNTTCWVVGTGGAC